MDNSGTMHANSHVFTSATSNEPILWDYMLDLKTMDAYNMMMPPHEYMSPLDSSNASSPTSEHALPQPDRRRSSNSMTDRSTIPDKIERRREQNRQSQRAYRDRKEKHQRDLEGQIAEWKVKHEKLVRSCTAQSAQISQLKAQVAELNAQLLAAEDGFSSESWSTSSPQADFDMVPFFDSRQGWTMPESL